MVGTKEIIMGRKTFFFMPDSSMVADIFLEEYMARGYETYIIRDDKACPFRRKVDLITSVFTDAILFFNVDSEVEGINWRSYIAELQKSYGENIFIGVIYKKRNHPEAKNQIEQYYLYDIGIQCGCIELTSDPMHNFQLIDSTLRANQAEGRRKTLRAQCEASSSVTIKLEGIQYRGKVLDVSTNHFSCTFAGDKPGLSIGTKITDAQLSINGLIFQTDAINSMTRKKEDGEVLHVLIFMRKDGSKGLDENNYVNLRHKIYSIIDGRAKELMNTLFAAN